MKAIMFVPYTYYYKRLILNQILFSVTAITVTTYF